MMFCYSETRKIKYLLPPPPPQKKGSRIERSRYSYTHKCLSIPAACDLDIHLVKIEQIDCFGLQSNPFIENYYLIIVVFSGHHFSIYDICYTLENTLSFNARATHLKLRSGAGVAQRLCNGLPHNDSWFDSRWEWCKNRASRPSQGTV